MAKELEKSEENLGIKLKLEHSKVKLKEFSDMLSDHMEEVKDLKQSLKSKHT